MNLKIEDRNGDWINACFFDRAAIAYNWILEEE